jgi:hypothetical protein
MVSLSATLEARVDLKQEYILNMLLQKIKYNCLLYSGNLRHLYIIHSNYTLILFDLSVIYFFAYRQITSCISDFVQTAWVQWFAILEWFMWNLIQNWAREQYTDELSCACLQLMKFLHSYNAWFSLGSTINYYWALNRF